MRLSGLPFMRAFSVNMRAFLAIMTSFPRFMTSSSAFMRAKSPGMRAFLVFFGTFLAFLRKNLAFVTCGLLGASSVFCDKSTNSNKGAGVALYDSIATYDGSFLLH
jgi:hypothetical protein